MKKSRKVCSTQKNPHHFDAHPKLASLRVAVHHMSEKSAIGDLETNQRSGSQIDWEKRANAGFRNIANLPARRPRFAVQTRDDDIKFSGTTILEAAVHIH
jgi:hypothetical protein